MSIENMRKLCKKLYNARLITSINFLASKKMVTGLYVKITGAGRGIGREMCFLFAKENANVICVDKNKHMNEKTANDIKNLYRCRADAFDCDVSDVKQVEQLAKNVFAKFQSVDILINNAGIINSANILNLSEDTWRKTMDVNFFACVWLTKAFLPEMLARNHGKIVNISSMAGLNGVAQLGSYCCSKFAITGFTETLRNELRFSHQSKVTAHSVHPYFTGTDMLQSKYRNSRMVLSVEKTAQEIVKGIKLGHPMILVPRIFSLFLFVNNCIPWFLRNVIMDNFIHGKKFTVFDSEIN